MHNYIISNIVKNGIIIFPGMILSGGHVVRRVEAETDLASSGDSHVGSILVPHDHLDCLREGITEANFDSN